MNEEAYPGYRNPDNFIVVSDPYPTVTAMAADLILPTAMWIEKEGAYGNAERRTQFWRQQVRRPGESKSDLWQLVEFSKRFKVEEVWPEELLAKKPEYRGKTLYDDPVSAMARLINFRKQIVTDDPGIAIPIMKWMTSVFTCKKACSRNTVAFGWKDRRKVMNWREFDITTRCVVCVGRLSTARKPYGVTVKVMIPMLQAAKM